MKAKNSPKNPSKKSPKPSPIQPILVGSLLLILALFLLISLFEYSPQKNRFLTTQPSLNHPTSGFLSITCAFWSYYFIGISSWLLPPFLTLIGSSLLLKKPHLRSPLRYSAMALSILAISTLANSFGAHAIPNSQFLHANTYPNGFGGLLGYALSSLILEKYLGLTFTFILTSLLSLISLPLSFFSYQQLLSLLQRQPSSTPSPSPSSSSEPSPLKARLKNFLGFLLGKSSSSSDQPPPHEDKPLPSIEKFHLPKNSSKSTSPIQEKSPSASPASNLKNLKIISQDSKPDSSSKPKLPKKSGSYTFPSIDLLSLPTQSEKVSDDEHKSMVATLIQTLSQFGVNVSPGEVHSGPVITRYEVIPAPGVRVEKILNLEKNIALALKAHSVRIQAPVPGKGTVGIEVPNKSPSPVGLREIIQSKSWSQSSSEIPIVLGKDVTGKSLIYDLTKMPHLLIAGSTGSGKTVCINVIIASLLYHSTPDDLRFIMVDPKVVEMQSFNSLPHMLIPVVTDPKRVPGALKWLITEMERRYQIFAAASVRNIAGFNAKILKESKEQQDAQAKELEANLSPEEQSALNKIHVPRDPDVELPKQKLPYIVCIIDELADLMMVAPADIETCIARLAQLARAAGIHLILATQRPSVNVITGVIKANLPCRISFKVASQIDSRTILDSKGAEQLLGRGDMLFIPPGSSELMRAQGAHASDQEIADIVDALKINGPPSFAHDVQSQIDQSISSDPNSNSNNNSNSNSEWPDDLIPAALEVLQTTDRPSVSILQRRLKIGYNRAARIMDILHEQGLITSDSNSSPASPPR